MSPSKRQTDLAARAAAMGTRAPRQSVEPATIGGVSRAPKTSQVRLTTTLEPRTYESLVEFCRDAATELGETRVTHATVVRVFLDRLAIDPDLRSTITDDIEAVIRQG